MITESIVELNKWWKEGFSLDFKEREIYLSIKKYLPLSQMISLTGLRRVGKTTIMKKIVYDSIRAGFDPHNILYFSFDEYRDTSLRIIIKEYEELTSKDTHEGKYIFLLDEIQKLVDWENQVKAVYDNNPNIKIVISGSESLFIRKKSKESLAGRIFEFTVKPLTFNEFLRFKGVNFNPIKIYEKELQKLFFEFALIQGFPELINVNDKEIIVKYLKETVLERIIYKDIPEAYSIRDISVLRAIMNMITEEPGQIIELADMGKELRITRQTLSNYLEYLENSFLIRKIYNFTNNTRSSERKLKKYYPTICAPEKLFSQDALVQSKVFETIIVNNLEAKYFWRDPYKNEVDIIKDNIPIEIKFGKIETKGLEAFMKKFNISQGIILTKNKEEEIIKGRIKIRIIPAWKWLLE